MLRNLVSALSLFIFILYPFSIANSKEVEIKTIRVDIATSYGVLLTEVHFDKDDEINAQRVKNIIEKDLIKVIEYFQYVPRDIVHINLDPYMRISNGNALVFPTNIINLYQLPPSYSSHLLGINDWLRGVLFHEFIHITQLDMTKGLWNGARSVFGTVAKIPVSAVPSWFTEGIAVWGESHLLDSGRLNYPLFNKEMIVYFLRQNSCRTIDCLDTPGFYPNRSLSYIAGSHFLAYLEEKKPGTLSCLVKKNASKIPFFLNSSFKECAGLRAQNLFDEFRTHFINSQEPLLVEHEAWGVKVNNKFGVDYFQKGMVFDGEQLFKVEHNRYEEALVSYDVENNLHMTTAKFDAPIGEITQTMSFDSFKDEEGNKTKFLLASFYKDPHFRKKTKTWRLLDANTLMVEKELHFTQDPQYVFNLVSGQEIFLTASFEKLRWSLAKETLRSDLAQTISYEKLISFDPEFNLHQLEVRSDKVFIKYFYKNEYVFGFMKVEDLKNNILKINKIHSHPRGFSLLLVDDEAVIISDENKNDFLIELNSIPYKKSTINSNLLNRINQILLSSKATVVFEERIKSNMVGRSEVLATLRENAKDKTESLSEVAIENVSLVDQNTIAKLENAKSYPSLSHFIPHYWFLTTGSSENISSIGVFTEFNDPMYFTHFSLSLISYPEDRKIGGNLEINHKFQWPSDLLRFRAEINREFFKSNLQNRVNQEHVGEFSLFYNFLKEKWVLSPGVFVGYKESNDFISKTDLFNQGLMFGAQYKSLSYHETLQSLYGLASIQRSVPQDKEDYFMMKLKFDADVRFSDRFSFEFTSSYSKQFKSDFDRGVVFGGGTTDYLNSRFHPFYGLPYSDAFGNEIITARAQLDYNVFDVYRGYDFFPVFLKEIHLLIGREVMSADRIVIKDQKILANKMINSFFVGPRFDLNVFYYVPVSASIIFSRLTHSSIEAVNTVDFNVSISL